MKKNTITTIKNKIIKMIRLACFSGSITSYEKYKRKLDEIYGK